MAPEVVTAGLPKSPHYAHQVDTWSLGVMIFLMCALLLFLSFLLSEDRTFRLSAKLPFRKEDLQIDINRQRVDRRTVDWKLLPGNLSPEGDACFAFTVLPLS